MGCLIPVTAAVVLLGLGTCTVVTGWIQDRAIAGFTEQEPRKFGGETPPLGEDEAKALEAKLGELGEAAREARRVEVTLSAAELNHLLRTRKLLESLRDSTRILEIGPAGMEVASSQPLRKLGGGFRYLNATFVFRPVESGTNAWQLELQSIRVPGKEVPDGFVKMARQLHLFRFDLDAQRLQEVLQQVERVDLTGGAVVVVTRSGASAVQPKKGNGTSD